MTRYLLLLAASVAACTAPTAPQGGSNGNDRSNGGEQGETLLTGAMVVSPDGKFALMQRNATSVLLDVENRRVRELPVQVDRFVFAKTGGWGIAVLANRAGVVRYDLATTSETWRTTPAFLTTAGAMLARLSDDGRNLVLGDADRVLVLDAEKGDVRGAAKVGSIPAELAFVPGTSRALIVGTTRWANHLPDTDVVDVDLVSLATTRTSVPNCTAPIEVLPDASRALLSPTFCEEGQATSKGQWTNPDPVSVIDLAADGPHFLKNLPGFGPVAMDPSSHRAVAYLDVERMDEAMFTDKAKIPSRSGARYHIMTIDPKTLAYDLSPVGNVLPRFAMAKDGKALLVDATVQQVRGEATVKATIDGSGRVTVAVELFGKSASLFGLFDLEAKTYAPFGGPAASLDRFVQMGDGARVFTLKLSADGSGGDLYRIDVQAKTATSLGKNLRDIGLLADQKTMLLRERLPAVQVKTNTSVDWFRREKYCFSLDGITCTSEIEFQDSKPFQSGPSCTDYHDC